MIKTKETNMNIKPCHEINGTHLQGSITITFKELMDKLDVPHYTDGDKITAEWNFKTVEGVVFTIYDYKEDVTPKGLYDWHIGGHGELALTVVQKLFPNHKVGAY
jgi:hypothetical protein